MTRKPSRIYGRRCPKIQLCPTCGRMRVHHGERGYYSCPVPATVIEALRAFRRANGKTWRSRLKAAWGRGDDLGPELRQAKEMVGPLRLYKINV